MTPTRDLNDEHKPLEIDPNSPPPFPTAEQRLEDRWREAIRKDAQGKRSGNGSATLDVVDDLFRHRLRIVADEHLRDHYAAVALRDSLGSIPSLELLRNDEFCDQIADGAYRVADAMLRRRASGPLPTLRESLAAAAPPP